MKHHYTFQALVRSELLSREEEQRIFFLMRNAVALIDEWLPINDLDALASVLRGQRCYVAHNVITRKGRAVMFSGRTCLSTTADVLAFLDDAAQAGDVRPMLVSPYFTGQPDRVVMIDEDQICLYAVR